MSAESTQQQSGASVVSLKAPVRRYVSSFASFSEAKAVSVCATKASHCGAKCCSEAILASPVAKKRAFRA